MKVKETLAVILSCSMIVTLATACGSTSTSDVTNNSASAESTGESSVEGSAVFSASKDNTVSSDKRLSITVSGINGSINYTPIYIGLEQGLFDKANLDVDTVLFDNGPVQMEALASDSWDLGFTGVGGVLSGIVSYDATLVGATNTDNGTQTIWVRPDSDIAKTGSGHNTLNDKIVGDKDSWKGKTILCNSGTVLEYLLMKTLGGFDLDLSDVNIITMDAPTANSAFLAGQGDACVITGAISFAEDKADYIEASCGNWADTGLECSIIANSDSYTDPEKYEAMERFLKVYWDVIDWMNENPDEAAQYCSDFNAECGITLDADTAKIYLSQDPYYTADKVLENMTTSSDEGDYSIMEGNLVDIMKFFISAGKYNEGDEDKLLNHMDTKLMEEVVAK